MHISNDRCKALIIKIMKHVGLIVGCPVTLLPPNWALATKDSALSLSTPGKMTWGVENPHTLDSELPEFNWDLHTS